MGHCGPRGHSKFFYWNMYHACTTLEFDHEKSINISKKIEHWRRQEKSGQTLENT